MMNKCWRCIAGTPLGSSGRGITIPIGIVSRCIQKHNTEHDQQEEKSRKTWKEDIPHTRLVGTLEIGRK